MKCLAHKRSSSIDRLRRNYSSRRMPPASQPVTDVPKEEERPLMETQTILPQKRKRRYTGPDSLWSWVIAFANFFVNFVIVGLGRMSGVLYVDFINIFHIDRQSASMPFSVQQAARNLFGPLAGIFGQKYGVRFITIVGGFIGAVSAVTCFFLTDMLWITVMWGLFFGISTAFTTTLNQISIDQHFEKHRATAGGLAFSGGCVGAFFFPVVIEALMARYSITGTFLVLGAIILNVIPAAMLLKEPKKKDKTINEHSPVASKYGSFESTIESNVIHAPEEAVANTERANDTKAASKGVNFNTLRKNNGFVLRLLSLDPLDKALSKEKRENTLLLVDKIRMLDELEEMYLDLETLQTSFAQSSSTTNSSNGGSQPDNENEIRYNSLEIVKMRLRTKRSSKRFNETPRKQFIRNKLRELYPKDDSAFSSYFPPENQEQVVTVIHELKRLYELVRVKESLAPTQDDSDSIDLKDLEAKGLLEFHKRRRKRKARKGDPEALQAHIMTALKLHLNPLFLMICLCRGVFMLTFIPLVTVIVDFSMDRGLPQSDGKYMIALLSLGDFLGRLCLGWITDRGLLSLPRYMLVMMIVLGCSTASLPLTYSRCTLMPATLLFGILNGSLFVRHPLLVSKYMKPHEQVIGMGFINFLSGFIGFALPAFVGYFRDTLGSYDKMFYLNGAICGGVGFMWILEPILVKFLSLESSPYDKYNI